MILQALTGYYERVDDLPRQGWIRRGVDYILVLDSEGCCINIEPAGEVIKGKTIPREMLLPAIGKQALKHTNSGNDANLLWDNASFVFGTGNKGKLKIASFLTTLREWLCDVGDEGIGAVDRFCTNVQNTPDCIGPLLAQFGVEEDFAKRDPVLVFRLALDIEGVYARRSVRDVYERKLFETNAQSELKGTCLITGEEDTPLIPNETVIKGVWGAQPAGANIISFNARAFESYGKRHRNGENAPVSLKASFAYTTALNYLLSTKRQRIQVGDASTVFWAEQANPMEDLLADLFGEPPKDDPDRGTLAVESLYRAPQTGVGSFDDDGTRFFVLGLAPNAARIAVRFWQVATVGELAGHIKQHFADLAIVRGPHDPPYLSLFRLLVSTAALGKADNIPPNLAGDFMQSILAGRPYPQTLLQAAIRRVRAEHTVNHARASLIKACLNRQSRYHNPKTKEDLTVSLDESNANPGYRLGRLFAVLEKIQEEANPGINATIRDRYYGAASSTPVTVFQTLMRLKNHHLAKLDNRGRAVNLERLIGEIMDGIDDFPPLLGLPDQGRFTVGYYHQRQALFTKHEHH